MNLNETRKRVALLVESSRAYGRGLLVGIAKFAQMTDSWITTHNPERLLDEGLPQWFDATKFDGVIIRTDRKDILDHVVSFDIPTVDLRAAHDSRAYVVETDDQQVAELAANHLIECGHRRFGFCGYANANYSRRRLNFFERYLHSRGMRLEVYEARLISTKRTVTRIESAAVETEKEMFEWVASLPKPIGIMACNDVRGNQLLQACRQSQVSVPDEVAVVGVDNDEVMCNLSIPPLSSVENNTIAIGCNAAEILSRLMEDANGIERVHLVPPTRVVKRRSSDSSLVNDKEVSMAISFIKEHACRGIGVSNVVQAVPLSRASLERRFRKVTGKSINDEIKRVRLDKIKQLLMETDMKLAAIARLTGFKHPEYLSTLFKKELGITPSQFRQDHGLG